MRNAVKAIAVGAAIVALAAGCKVDDPAASPSSSAIEAQAHLKSALAEWKAEKIDSTKTGWDANMPFLDLRCGFHTGGPKPEAFCQERKTGADVADAVTTVTVKGQKTCAGTSYLGIVYVWCLNKVRTAWLDADGTA